jgi:predicted RNase H-like nuclease
VVRGWRHDVNPATDHQRFGRWLFEVYPHPAHVVLFDLPRIIKYKKGRMDSRREGLDNLRRAIVSHLGAGMPALIRNPTLQTLVEQDLSALRGPTLKEYEDRLDAVLCAFIAAHYWAWGRERNEMFGTMSFGYIVTPSRTVRGLRWTYERPARHMVPIVEQP